MGYGWVFAGGICVTVFRMAGDKTAGSMNCRTQEKFCMSLTRWWVYEEGTNDEEYVRISVSSARKSMRFENLL